MAGSEYGGMPGIIQPDLSRVDPEAAAAGLVHDSTQEGADRRAVRDAAMVMRRAGLKDARGVVGSSVTDPDTGLTTTTPYSEEQAREDYLDGNNY